MPRRPMLPDTDKFTQLLAFAWSIEAGSFSAAARAHHLSPSAISKLVTRLENRLGVRLFVRLQRSVAPTAEGREYYRIARVALDALADADSVGDALAGGTAGVLRVHTMPSFAQHQIAPWLPAFLEQHPALRVEFHLSAQYVDLFDQGMDVAIHSGAISSPSRVARQIAASRWIVCASPAYLRQHGAPGHPSELASHRCLGFGFSSVWNRWHFKQDDDPHNVEPAARVATTQGEMLRELALRGGGIVRLAEFHIGEDLLAGRLVRVLPQMADEKPEPLYVVYAARKNLSPRIRVFQDALVAFVATQPWARHAHALPAPAS